MTNNNILKFLQKITQLDDNQIIEVFHLIDTNISDKRIQGYLKDKDDKDYLDCGAVALEIFLDGLIIYKRGDSGKKKEQAKVKLTNNLILKKLRIAFDLKDADMFTIFESVDIQITKTELASLFRNENHKKFRYCPDSILQLFLEGLEVCEKG